MPALFFLSFSLCSCLCFAVVVDVCLFSFCCGPLCFSSLIFWASVLVPLDQKIKLEKYIGPQNKNKATATQQEEKRETKEAETQTAQQQQQSKRSRNHETYKFQKCHKMIQKWISRDREFPLVLTRRMTNSVSHWGGTDDPIFHQVEKWLRGEG